MIPTISPFPPAAPIFLADIEVLLFGGGLWETFRLGSDGGDHLSAGAVIAKLDGGAGDDTLVGYAFGDWLIGGEGADTLRGGGGADLLDGGAGDDWLTGNTGDDYLFGGEGADQLSGGDGEDRLSGGAADDWISGGAGDDLTWGGEGADRIYGGAGADLLDGGGGDDWLDGGTGDDFVHGGGDNDLLLLRAGDDVAEGGAGDDRIYGHAGNDTISGGDGADIIDGGTDDDLIGGGDGADTIYAGLGDDVVWGGAGNDDIFGHAGNDWLAGEDGDDFLNGHAGADILTGGLGSDRLVGGDGSDIARFGGLMADYVVTLDPSVVQISSGSDLDTLQHVEFVEFADGMLNLAAMFGLKVDPVAQDDVLAIVEDTAGQLIVLANDYDDGSLTLTNVGTAANGTVTAIGGGVLEYMPDADFFGEDGFSYDITDADGNVSSGWVHIDISGVNDAPEAISDVLYIPLGDASAAVSVLDNDNDKDGDVLSAVAETGVTAGGGSYTITATGEVEYFAPTSFAGSESFTYTVVDGHGGSSTGTVMVTSNPTFAPESGGSNALWVGEGEEFATLREAARASQEGDTIYVRAGTYIDDYATFKHSVSIIGVGGKAHFIWQGDETIQGGHLIPNGKGILNIEAAADYVYVENLILEGAVVGDRNGAGIRHQGKDVVVLNSEFIDNQNGILAVSSDPGASVTVLNSVFDGNGYEDGLAHSLYIKDAGSLIIDNTVIRNTVAGHHVKSMAGSTTITNSVLDDGSGTSSFAVDVSKGGDVLIEGNTIHQTATGQAPPIVSYGVSRGGDTGLVLIKNNTITNEAPAGLLVRNDTATIVTLEGNTVTNTGAGTMRWNDGLAEFIGNSLDGQAVPDAGAFDAATVFGNGADVIDGTLAEDFFLLGGGDDTAFAIQGNDIVMGGDGADVIYGGHGFDNIYGDADDDTLIGAGSDDLLAGGGGIDTIYGGIGADMILGGTGGDIIVGGIGGDVINGQDGVDISVYRDVFSAYIYTAAGGRHFFNGSKDMADWGRDQLVNVEKAQFLDGYLDLETGEWFDGVWLVDAAVFEGPPDPGALSGPPDSGGLPLVAGTAASQEIITGSAQDEALWTGGGTADSLAGGAGDDSYFSFGVTLRVVEQANEGTDTLFVYSEWGRLDDNVENLVLKGSEHSNGYGNALNNHLTGNDGRNRLEGGAGDDVLNGGADNDILVGGAGQDRFVFSGPNPGADWIIGFEVTEDIVQVDQSLIGSATVTDLVNAAAVDHYGASLAVGDLRLTFGKIDPGDLTAANFEIV